MSDRRDIDKAIRNLMQWGDRPEWAQERAAAFDTHLAPVCRHLAISPEDLGQELAEHGYAGVLFGVLFEDFASRDPEPGARNPIDDYLARRSWRETVPGRRYLRQLRTSLFSLYEVVAVDRGHHCDVRDLVRGGPVVRVHEQMGTQNLVRWDRLGARVLSLDGKHVFSGGILPFSPEATPRLLHVLDESRKKLRKKRSRAAGKGTTFQAPDPGWIDQQLLKEAGPAFISIWLLDVLGQLRAPPPELVNRDGDALVFTETRFPVAEQHRDAVMERLDTAAGWVRDPGGPFWTWFSPPQSFGPGGPAGALPDGARPVSGSAELQAKALMFVTNSLERTELGKGLLLALLQGLVGPPLTQVQTPEQMMAQHTPARQGPARPLDPEVAAAVTATYLDQHYRRCLDDSIPALAGKTPRQCARSKRGRILLIDWLKSLENQELHRAVETGATPYDFGWMWAELKLDRTQ